MDPGRRDNASRGRRWVDPKSSWTGLTPTKFRRGGSSHWGTWSSAEFTGGCSPAEAKIFVGVWENKTMGNTPAKHKIRKKGSASHDPPAGSPWGNEPFYPIEFVFLGRKAVARR